MDRVKRGYEVYARELFDLLKQSPEFRLTLIKGSGHRYPDERVVFSLPRESFLNRFLCRFVGDRWRFYIEYLTFALGMAPLLALRRFDALYVLEAPLYKFLGKWRRWTKANFKLIHFTGGQLGSIPATTRDYLHHVSPAYQELACACGFSRENQFLLPHFIDTAAWTVPVDQSELETLRRELGVAAGARVVLSVGSIDCEVKRMDYVIRECAACAQPTFVLLVGQPDVGTEAVRTLAQELLGERRFAIRTVPRRELVRYYAVADVFILASLREGFGLVFLEALCRGLPVVAHDYPVSRFVLGDFGHYADLSQPGRLTRILDELLSTRPDRSRARAAEEYIRQTYDVKHLREAYVNMFLKACGSGLQSVW